MIPKKIHYIWLGNNQLSNLQNFCIKKNSLFNQYEQIWWDEKSIPSFPMIDYFVERKEWGFVSDIMRFWILYNHGGIYIDCDIEIINSFDDILEQNTCIVEVFDGQAHNSILMAEKNHKYIERVLNWAVTTKDFKPHLLDNFQSEISPKNIPQENIKIDDVLFCGNENFVKRTNRKTFYEKMIERSNIIKNKPYFIHYHDGSWLR